MPGAERNDEDLMLAYGAGEITAFEELYSRHRGPLFRFMVRQVREHGTAEELFQDVWHKVIGARERYRPEAKFSTWLYQIAHNRLTDHWRAQSHRPPVPEDAVERAEREPDPQTPERQLSAFEERRRLQLALEQLPDDQRETVLLRLEQDLSLEEIAAITGVGRETVKSRLRYAMDKLRQRMNP
jgi:RNA polymerase sigma factor (sigma-70 family)